MGPSRTDYSRKIDYTAIKDGQVSLDDTVLRLIKGIRGPRFNPIHLQDIFDWFRGAPQEMVLKSIHKHEDDNLIIKVSGGYRVKTFGDTSPKARLSSLRYQEMELRNAGPYFRGDLERVRAEIQRIKEKK